MKKQPRSIELEYFHDKSVFGVFFVNTESVHENKQVFHFVPPGDWLNATTISTDNETELTIMFHNLHLCNLDKFRCIFI